MFISIFKMIDKAVEINGEDTFIDNNTRVYNKLVEGRIEKLMISVWKRVLFGEN